MSSLPIFGVSDFVEVFNQTINYAFPLAVVEGELSDIRISRGKWAYFNLVDKKSSVKFFGSTLRVPSSLENGMMLRVAGQPRLHDKYGFSVTVQSIELVGEGTIKKASSLLEQKLQKEGLFSLERKRSIPYPPNSIGLITSLQSAAYSDFIKIINHRWMGVDINVMDVLVQGRDAPEQIIQAITNFNQLPKTPDVLVIIRGGGGLEDLQAFDDERVVRSVAGSRIPTVVAIGHERDIALSEKVADARASTPSNAAEIIVPSKNEVKAQITELYENMKKHLEVLAGVERDKVSGYKDNLVDSLNSVINGQETEIQNREQILLSLNPTNILKRGYAIVRKNGVVTGRSKGLEKNDSIGLEFFDGTNNAVIR